MLFNSTEYLIFLPIVVALYWICPFKYRTALLLLASYVFYMTWKPIYGLLMMGLTIANYFIGLSMAARPTEGKARKRLMVAGIWMNVLALCYFKYAYFCRDSANGILSLFHFELPKIPFDIILPLGISFFVFEFIHYLVDVYRGSAPVKNFMEFALFPSFFPTQIAGPIKRYQDFCPQLRKPHKLTVQEFDTGIELLLFGLFKKVIVGDGIGMLVSRFFAHPDLLTSVDAWLACYAFAFQVYFDFSGYTDIARGSAQLMGFKVPINFNLPFLSSSFAEYWKRWHISLGLWLKDYVYIPLGGSKGGRFCAERNLFLTMLIAGVWHGAAMHYVVWGAYQGLALAMHKEWRHWATVNTFCKNVAEAKMFKPFAILLTFNTFVFGMAMFRSETIATGLAMTQKLLFITPQPIGLSAFDLTIPAVSGSAIYPMLPLILLVLTAGQIWTNKYPGPINGIAPIPPRFNFLRPVYLAAMACILMAFSPDIAPQFVYFQF
ncbi:MAG: hypothetical protein KGS72_20575 [Cyanobacteria bacterium REEB67]|nr:hypothetical protein [Cyanobacteria bacterium REEB67]